MKRYLTNLSKVALLGLCLALLCGVSMVATLAWLQQETSSVTNTFAGVALDCEIKENFEDGDTLKKDVTVTNNGTIPAYLRVKLTAQAYDAEAAVVAHPILEIDVQDDLCGGYRYRDITLDDFDISPWQTTTKGDVVGRWVQVGAYYYYTQPVQPKEQIALFVQASLKSSVTLRNDSDVPALTVLADFVQENALTKGNVWPEVAVASDGSLGAAGEGGAHE